MNNLKQIAKTIRLPNLFLLALTQWIVLTFLLKDFSYAHYFLITFSTVFIALAGYLLNDIRDIEIDKTNNQLRLINEENRDYWTKLVILFNVLGLGLGFWASYLSELSYFTYFVIAIMLLTAYAYFLSKYKFIGNLIISFLIALSIILAFYLGKGHPDFFRKYMFFDEIATIHYALLAFQINWLRELIKDVEDEKGDRLAGRYSLVIILNKAIIKIIVAFVLLSLAPILFWAGFTDLAAPNYYYYFLSGLTILLFVFVFTLKAPEDFKRMSLLLKLYMFFGILLPIFLQSN